MKGYMNLKIKTKLILFSVIMAVISIIIGAIGTVSITLLRQEDQEMYERNTVPLGKLAALYDIVGSQRVRASNMVIFCEADPEFSAAETAKLAEKEEEFEEMFASYKETISPDSPEEQAIYDKMSEEYFVVFAPIKAELRRAVAEKDIAAMPDIIKQVNKMGSLISGYVDEAVELNIATAADKVAANEQLAATAGIVQAGAILFGLVFAIFCAFYLSNIISKPMRRIMAITRQAGESGDLDFSQEQMDAVRRDAQHTDETGLTAAAFISMMDSLIEKIRILEKVAEGDLSVEIDKIGNQDTLGSAIEDMTANLNNMFEEIMVATDQVSTCSGQIAQGAQLLAQSSTEQSSTVTQLLTSLSEIADKARENTSRAGHAASLASNIKQSAEEGTAHMSRMTQAVADINTASSAISAVIKIIDDLAFQTNILALNAAVESARAGVHGKGFAVVADEVRNLAGKSAEAAKNTSSLIANTVEKAKLGAQIAQETSLSLSAIATGINESSAVVEEIARASQQQSTAIEEVNISIDQMSQAVHRNSATSEESAATAEEMDTQANALKKLLTRFKLKSQTHKALPEADVKQTDVAFKY